MEALTPFPPIPSTHPLQRQKSQTTSHPPTPLTDVTSDQLGSAHGALAATAAASQQASTRAVNGARNLSSAGLLSATMPTNGGIAVPPGPNPVSQPQQQQQPPGLPGIAVPSFEGSRSPPNSKNLSHVPCKFFRQGTCQAGKACPFSHSADPASDQAPCKYFQKGNCKFGAKCALAHILPDGRRVGRHSFNHLGLGAKTYVEPNHTSRSALHNSLVQAQMIPPTRPQFGDIPEGYPNYLDQRPQDPQHMADGSFAAPRGNELPQMSSPLLSSSHRTLGPLDATLPSSFDSNGISFYARLLPVAASVPSKFGLESPPMSLPQESRALKSLHASAFGEEDTIGALALSPPTGEDTLGHRLQMQSRLRAPYLSASMPRTGLMLGDWTKDKLQGDLLENMGNEEDFIPGSLTGDILTPQENVIRNRRMSANHEVASGFAFGSPRETGSAVGSPIVGSPSRFGALFSRTKREEEPMFGGLGHVGSPLRNSHLQNDSPPFGNLNRTTAGDAITSPISALTQKLTDTHIDSDLEGQTRAKTKSLSRGIPSTPTSSKVVSSIDEETQFSMDDEDDNSKKQQKTAAIPITGNRRPSTMGMDEDWKTFAKRDIKPLR
ncbi:hypothetical protein L211DRAFT_18261 [Terfezia boudieri ATCC MYA-4762]|uniref:C3H1-type domain-containing protein n=1 Tax=Terfezia boudieri ATCC MYA-4762 TaxID=1051890 RepID=A0A3N4M2T5_9PEZI|nr:hypothetical protein L211DRAFT_18261 [Terfezia boudieri ATCC MYA-4762]